MATIPSFPTLKLRSSMNAECWERNMVVQGWSKAQSLWERSKRTMAQYLRMHFFFFWNCYMNIYTYTWFSWPAAQWIERQSANYGKLNEIPGSCGGWAFSISLVDCRLPVSMSINFISGIVNIYQHSWYQTKKTIKEKERTVYSLCKTKHNMYAWFMLTWETHFSLLFIPSPLPPHDIICPTQPEMLKEINQQMRDSVEKTHHIYSTKKSVQRI